MARFPAGTGERTTGTPLLRRTEQLLSRSLSERRRPRGLSGAMPNYPKGAMQSFCGLYWVF